MKDKHCTGCNETKPIAEFAWSNKAKGTYNSRCRACQSVASRKWYQKNRDKQRAYVARNNARYRAVTKAFLTDYLLANPCVDCGESDPALLQFDHVRGDRLASVSTIATWGRVNDRLIEEIAKCEVRCANCHRRRHTLKRRNEKARRARMQTIKDDLETIFVAVERLRVLAITPPAVYATPKTDGKLAENAQAALERICERLANSVPVEQAKMEGME